MADTEFQQLAKTDRNPVQETRYQELLKQQGGLSGTGSSSFDPFDYAKKAQQMQVDANQPAIQTLQTHKTDLDSKYSDLLSSIKGQQGVAENAQITATNNELGKRGITSDSGIAQQQMAGALRPIDAQYQGLTAQTGLSREQDETGLAAQIAALQAGNLPNAFNFSTGVGQLQNQSASLAAQIAQNQTQNEIAQKQAQYVPLGYGGLYNTSTGGVVDTTRPSSVGKYGLYDPSTQQFINSPAATPVQSSSNNNYYNVPSTFIPR